MGIIPKKEDILNIIPERKIESPRWVAFAIIGGISLLIVLAGMFFYFNTLISNNQSQTSELDEKITFLMLDPQTTENAKTVSLLSEKINNFAYISKERAYSSNFFDFLKTICHTKSQFKKASVDFENYRASVTGATSNFLFLGEQIVFLKQNPNIANLQVSHSGIDQSGEVSFDFSFDVNKDIFK